MSAYQHPHGAVIDWARLRPEILERYRALVQLDTTAGHEVLAVDYLRKVLESEGIPTQTFALDPTAPISWRACVNCAAAPFSQTTIPRWG